MRIKHFGFGAIGAVAGGLFVMAVLFVGAVDIRQANSQESWKEAPLVEKFSAQAQAHRYPPAVAKCILSNVDNAHSDRAASIMAIACASLHK